MSFPPRPEPLTLEGPAGVLEAILEDPHADRAGFGVVCHPHPQHGGTMHNKVVHTLARTLQELGVPTLRFNYRGVGASAGSFDQGRGETLDALAVIAHGARRWPGPLWLAGFSFGALVSLRAAAVAQPLRLISVAPAVTRTDFADVQRPACPWLIVQGEDDEIVDAGAVSEFAARFEPPAELRTLVQAGHFFHGRLHELHDIVRDFCLPDAAPAR